MIESCSPSLEIVRRERGAVDSGSLDVRELEGGGGVPQDCGKLEFQLTTWEI